MFYVLGGVRAELEDGPVVLPGQVRRLLGILLAEHDEPVATTVLIDRLWSGDPPRTARKIVHILASKLRHAIQSDSVEGESEYLETTTDGYRLHGSACDLRRYEELLDDAELVATSAPRKALAALEEALELWARPWGCQADEPWLVSRVSAIEERHRRAEELFGDLALETGCAPAVVDRLRAAVVSEPFRERRWAQLMLRDVPRRTAGRRVARLRRGERPARGRVRRPARTGAAAAASGHSRTRRGLATAPLSPV